MVVYVCTVASLTAMRTRFIKAVSVVPTVLENVNKPFRPLPTPGRHTYIAFDGIVFVSTPEGCTQEAEVATLLFHDSRVTETNFLWRKKKTTENDIYLGRVTSSPAYYISMCDVLFVHARLFFLLKFH